MAEEHRRHIHHHHHHRHHHRHHHHHHHHQEYESLLKEYMAEEQAIANIEADIKEHEYKNGYWLKW